MWGKILFLNLRTPVILWAFSVLSFDPSTKAARNDHLAAFFMLAALIDAVFWGAQSTIRCATNSRSNDITGASLRPARET